MSYHHESVLYLYLGDNRPKRNFEKFCVEMDYWEKMLQLHPPALLTHLEVSRIMLRCLYFPCFMDSRGLSQQRGICMLAFLYFPCEDYKVGISDPCLT